jgi:peptidoglycan/LPS O-acetylase OafA/YrhL
MKTLQNNFHLIRLIAALQVIVSHCCTFFNLDAPYVFSLIISWFPGVPIFFFTSGFLISKSYENCNSLKNSYRNRFYRLYPELWVGLIISILTVIFSGHTIPITLRNMLGILAQSSFFQWYGISGISNYGTGILNVSLWTISIEIQFYIILPFLYKIKTFDKNYKFFILISLGFIFFQAHQNVNRYYIAEIDIYHFMKLTILPHFWMFLVGIWM